MLERALAVLYSTCGTRHVCCCTRTPCRTCACVNWCVLLVRQVLHQLVGPLAVLARGQQYPHGGAALPVGRQVHGPGVPGTGNGTVGPRTGAGPHTTNPLHAQGPHRSSLAAVGTQNNYYTNCECDRSLKQLYKFGSCTHVSPDSTPLPHAPVCRRCLHQPCQAAQRVAGGRGQIGLGVGQAEVGGRAGGGQRGGERGDGGARLGGRRADWRGQGIARVAAERGEEAGGALA